MMKNVNMIIMLTRLVEKHQVKAEKYWPDNNNDNKNNNNNNNNNNNLSLVFGKVKVKFIDEIKHSDDVIERKLLLNDKKEIVHIHYTGWPDFGAPDSIGDIKTILKLVNNFQSKEENKKSPILVHCSAGLGRSGIAIAAHIFEQQIKHKIITEFTVAHVVKIIEQLREQRPGMVQTYEQFEFLVKLAKYLFKANTNKTNTNNTSTNKKQQKTENKI